MWAEARPGGLFPRLVSLFSLTSELLKMRVHPLAQTHQRVHSATPPAKKTGLQLEAQANQRHSIDCEKTLDER